MGPVPSRSRLIVVLSLVVPVLMVAAAGAWAHDHRVPRATLHVNGQRDQLVPWSFSWVSRSGQNCVGEEGDGVPNFRPRADVHLHSTPRIVFRKEQRPRRVRALAAEQLENGYLADPKPLDVKLEARHRGQRRVWVAKLNATVRQRLFVDLHARWRDREGCGGPESASWDFSLRRP
jgi:hypothetical protein